VDIAIPALWLEPITQPMKLLIYCLGFGIVHLFTGLGIKGYMMLKQKDVTAFICDVVLWYVFLIGLILLLLPTKIFASLAGGQLVFPPAVNMLAKGMAIFGMLGILLMAGRRAKNPIKRLLLGAYSLYDTTSWLSDLLSYSRLLALGLATGVIAQVVNKMAAMGGRSIGGVILFIVVFIFGHTFNMAINLLGAYVHTNRLQFVEFFGKFYEGGGREFKPFKENTKYIHVKEN
jgi:V/A-type H+-transporting ATPase subunit I